MIGHAQSNIRCKWVPFDTLGIEVDSMSIDVESIQIISYQRALKEYFDTESLGVSYSLSDNLVKFSWNSRGIPPESVKICYRVFPFNFSKSYQYRDANGYYKNRYQFPDRLNKKDSVRPLEREELFALKGLDGGEIEKTGSLTRGVTFGTGNAQDVAVTSALNLQLEGKLTKDLELVATISDQNVPFQPEGNTQQLQDFDQILIELRHKYGLLSAGDVLFENDTTSYYLKYYKNVQGAQIQANYTDSSGWYFNSKLGISAAKGQFNSDTVAAIEGIQGPYRLRGANGERFIVILAGSEKVFLDGKPLKRGYDFDYTIDYNTAEVTFTNQIVITQFSRIRVDFEYATQNYARSILQTGHTIGYKKFETSFQFYRERDNKNAALLLDLSDADKQILADAGDDVTLAVAPTATAVDAFTPNEILYTQIDSVVAGVTYQVFRRATETDDPLFSVVFSEVGVGNGDYILGDPTANGREYIWVVPVGGVSQGSYAPVRQLPAPNQRQLLTWQLKYRLSNYESVTFDWGISNHDENLFATKGNADNVGNAWKLSYQSNDKPSSLLKGYRQSQFISLEYLQENFRIIDRFRGVDFDRDWSIESQELAIDRIASTGIKLTKKQDFLEYSIAYRDREKQAKGIQQRAGLHQTFGNFRLKSEFFWLASDRDSTQASWQRLLADAAWQGNILVTGYQFSLDQNSISTISSDSVLRTLMNFRQHQVYVQSSDSLKWRFRTDFSLRTDFSPIRGNLEKFTEAQTLNFKLNRKTKKQELTTVFTFRGLDSFLDSMQLREENIMGRIDWQRQFFKRNVQSDLSWATASGRELKREFFFLPVDVGLGTHTWRDDNGDGIQDLSEFYEAINPEERIYAKFFRPTDEYIRAFSTTINYRLKWQFPAAWKKEKGMKKRLQAFSGNLAFLVTQKTTKESLADRLFPSIGNTDDENLIASQMNWLNTIFYNKRNPKFGAEWQWRFTDNKQLLTAGFQRNRLASQLVRFRRNWSRFSSSNLELSQGVKSLSSDVLSTQNYEVQTLSVKPEMILQPKRSLRFTMAYVLKDKQNLQGSETAQINEFSLQVRLSKQVKSALIGNIRFINIDFEGSPNSPVGYELLEALNPGQNWRWELNWSQRLANGLQLRFSYNGRKPPSLPAIHVGSVQATALF